MNAVGAKKRKIDSSSSLLFGAEKRDVTIDALMMAAISTPTADTTKVPNEQKRARAKLKP